MQLQSFECPSCPHLGNETGVGHDPIALWKGKAGVGEAVSRFMTTVTSCDEELNEEA